MQHDFDLIVIGGGSGGLAAAQRAAEYGARVALIEAGRLGGTCVNVGCVPKKLMWNAGEIAGALSDATGYGFDLTVSGHDWPRLKATRDAYILRLNGIYESNLAKRKVTLLRGWAELLDGHRVRVGEKTLSAERVLIASGGQPQRLPVPGAERGLDSDGFFELAQRPARVAILGGGYIGVEIAGVFAALGSKVTQIVRGEHLLRGFDPMLVEAAETGLIEAGATLRTHAQIKALQGAPALVGAAAATTVLLEGGEVLGPFDSVIWATGRRPITNFIAPELGLQFDATGHIQTDEWQQTSVASIFAIGDVTGRVTLTPVAIAAGRRLSDRLWGGMVDRKLSYEQVATVVFGHPPLGTVGLTEPEARARYGDAVKVYQSQFVPLFHAMTTVKPKTRMKLVTVGAEQRVVGVHLAGRGVDEMLQGFAVAMRMGATKRDLDDTIAIHPTAAEELVTMR